MSNLESLKSSINYYVHFVFIDNMLDHVFISHSQKVFNQTTQIMKLSFGQFQAFPNLGCNVQWGNDTMTPNQWIEYWEETNRI